MYLVIVFKCNRLLWVGKMLLQGGSLLRAQGRAHASTSESWDPELEGRRAGAKAGPDRAVGGPLHRGVQTSGSSCAQVVRGHHQGAAMEDTATVIGCRRPYPWGPS